MQRCVGSLEGIRLNGKDSQKLRIIGNQQSSSLVVQAQYLRRQYSLWGNDIDDELPIVGT